MTQQMRKVERGKPVARRERAQRRGEEALRRLMVVAGRGRGEAELVVALLETVADAAEHHRTRNELPAAEQDLWTSTGAHFDNKAVPRNDEQLVAAFAELVATSVIGDTAMAKTLGVDRSRVSQRLADRSLYAFPAGEERCFPRWQLVKGKTVPGLKTVLVSIDPGLHPLSVQHWFTTPNVDLEIDDHAVSPAAWLATGGAAGVAAELAQDL